MTEATETVQAPPFHTYDRDGMRHHIETAHSGVHMPSKITRGELTRLHDRQHERGAFIMLHEHVEMEAGGTPLTDEPLSAAQRTVLTKLVDNDFNALRKEMEQLAADTLEARIEAIKEDYAQIEATAKAAQQQMQKELAKSRKRIDRIKNETNGIQWNYNRSDVGRYVDFTYTVRGLLEQQNEARQENRRLLERALLTLERQRLTAQRRVLISAVSAEARQIVDDVPTAKALMQQAYTSASQIGSS